LLRSYDCSFTAIQAYTTPLARRRSLSLLV
jgi:hypothetical protein